MRKLKIGVRKLLRKFGIGKRKVKIDERRNLTQEFDASSSSIECKPKPSVCGRGRSGKPKKVKSVKFCPLYNPYKDNLDVSDSEDFQTLGWEDCTR